MACDGPEATECGREVVGVRVTWGDAGPGEKGVNAASDVKVVSTARPGAAKALRNQSTTLAAADSQRE